MTVLALEHKDSVLRSELRDDFSSSFVFILGVVIDHFVNFSGSSSFLLSLPIQGLLPVLFFPFSLLLFGWFYFF
jgi:hypothetical protein